jgi:hypothetical protein
MVTVSGPDQPGITAAFSKILVDRETQKILEGGVFNVYDLRLIAKTRTQKKAKADGKPRCGLCGKTKKLTKTECCGEWICDDEDKYVLFSYARNSCYRVALMPKREEGLMPL